jgi:hypothetical protein
VTASTQTNYSVTTADGTLTISVPSSSSVGSSTAVLEQGSMTFPLPPRGRSAVFIALDDIPTVTEDEAEFDLNQASGG